MKRLLLFLFLVGAAVYLFMGPDTPEADQTPTARHAELSPREPLHTSWGSNLQSLRETDQEPPAQTLHVSTRPTQQSQETSDRQETPDRQVEQLSAAADERPAIMAAVGPAVQWVKITRAVEMRREADVASPGFRHYPAGSEVMAVGASNVWVQLLDPTTQERGWVYHNFLTPIEVPSSTRPVLEASSRKPQIAATQERRREPGNSRADRGSAKVATAERPRSRVAERPNRRGFRLFGFRGRKAERSAWTLGPSR